MPTTTLLEREQPLAQLADALATAAQGQGSVVLITGEPGIGKTALVTAFSTALAGRARVLTGICDDLSTPRTLGAFRDLATSWGPRVAEALQERATPVSLHAILLEELREGHVPTVLVLEDVHWADQATLDAVTVIGRRLPDLPVLVVLTARTGELAPGSFVMTVLDGLRRAGVRHLELGPLSRDGVAALAGEDADRVYELTGGNPFFVTEILARPDVALPPSLANAVLGRVARCPPESRRLLELVSMAPGRMPTDVLDSLEPRWPAAADYPERAQLLAGDAYSVRFRHELTRAAIRSSVPPARRRQLHRRILDELLRSRADPAEIVHHAETAGAVDVLAEHAGPAAAQAEAAGAVREALAHYRRAASVADLVPEEGRASVWEGLARTAYLAGETDTALDAVDHAVELHERTGSWQDAGRCVGQRAQLHWYGGDGRAAWRDACAAVRTLEPLGHPVDLAHAYVQSAELAMLASRTDDALRWSDRALQLAGDDPHVRTRVLASAGAARVQLDPEDTATLLSALEVASDCGEHHHAVLALVALAFVNTQWVRPELAVRACEQGGLYAQAHEVDGLADYLDALLAGLRARAGDREDAVRLLGQGAGPAGPPRPSITALQRRIVMTELAVRRGDEGVGDQLVELAAIVDRTGELKRIGPVLELQVEHALTHGDPLPVARFEEVRGLVGDTALQAGAGAARVCAWASVCDLPWPPPPRLPAPHAAMVARDWRGAAEAFGEVGWQHDRALMLSLLDDAEALGEALDIARAEGAEPLRERVCHRLRQLGLPVPRGPAASTRDNPAGLTDRQVEVLSLVGRGRSNAQIAQTLHISPRTVEHHVAAILDRLGAGSRAEAVARCGDLLS